MLNPKLFFLNGAGVLPDATAFLDASWLYSKPEPWKEAPPDFVTAMIWPPVDDPYSGA